MFVDVGTVCRATPWRKIFENRCPPRVYLAERSEARCTRGKTIDNIFVSGDHVEGGGWVREVRRAVITIVGASLNPKK